MHACMNRMTAAVINREESCTYPRAAARRGGVGGEGGEGGQRHLLAADRYESPCLFIPLRTIGDNSKGERGLPERLPLQRRADELAIPATRTPPRRRATQKNNNVGRIDQCGCCWWHPQHKPADGTTTRHPVVAQSTPGSRWCSWGWTQGVHTHARTHASERASACRLLRFETQQWVLVGCAVRYADAVQKVFAHAHSHTSRRWAVAYQS